MDNKDYYLPGIAVSGLIAGVLSGLPFISAVNCCFCAWIVGAGAVSVRLIGAKCAFAIERREGAFIGLLTGLVAGVVGGGIGALFAALGGSSEAALLPHGDPGAQQIARVLTNPAISAGAAFCGSVVIFPVFGALGGLLGTAIFKTTSEAQLAQRGGGGPYDGVPPAGGGRPYPGSAGGDFGAPAWGRGDTDAPFGPPPADALGEAPAPGPGVEPVDVAPERSPWAPRPDVAPERSPGDAQPKRFSPPSREPRSGHGDDAAPRGDDPFARPPRGGAGDDDDDR